jgi:inosine/guanosine/xanthosine phosphorylase family protein
MSSHGASADKLADRAARLMRSRSRVRPTLAIILGSGFHSIANCLDLEMEIPYPTLPGFPRPSVGGHAGCLRLGTLAGVPLCVLSGRAHYYEGYTMQEITRPVRALAAFGIRDLLVTNAAGGIRRGFRPGDFMLLTDHINLMGDNPLRGGWERGRERFVDMTRAYDTGLSQLLRRAARRRKVRLRQGIYLAVAGPSYETPAEIRAFAALGADAVGMSTVPEVLVARQLGMAVAGLSCLTNLAAGLGDPLLSHADVLAAGHRAGKTAAVIIEQFVRNYARRD